MGLIVMDIHGSLRQQVFALLTQYPTLKPKAICKLLHADNIDYVRHLRSEWVHDYVFGLGSKLPSPSYHKARFWVFVDRLGLSREKGMAAGWIESKNRNRALIFRDEEFGRIEWHFKSGKVILQPSQPSSMGRVYSLFCRGFYNAKSPVIESVPLLTVVLGEIRFKGATKVWDGIYHGKPIIIDDFKLSNGVVIKAGDLSHREGIEVEYCLPDWAERSEAQLARSSRILEELTKILKGEQTTEQQDQTRLPDFYTR